MRFSALAEWKKTVTTKHPMLAEANADVALEAMEMGYPQDRGFFKKQLAARDVIAPALIKLYRDGNTPISILKEVAEQVTAAQR